MTTFTFATSGVHTPILLSAHAAYSASRSLINAGVDQVVPFVVRRPDTPTQHDITALFPSYAAADAFATALRSGELCAVSIADALQTNLVTDPRATSGPPWAAFGGVLATETLVTGASDGPTLPDGSKPTTYVRYAISTPAGGNAQFGFVLSAVDELPSVFPAGGSLAAAIYVRSSVAAANIAARKDGYLDTVGSGGSQAGAGTLLPAATWQRRTAFVTNNAPLNGFRVAANFPSTSQFAGQVVEVTCALFALGVTAVPDHFDGVSAPPRYSSGWTGPANASASVLVPMGVQVEQFDGISSSQVRVQNTPGIGATEVQFTLTEVPA